VEQQELKLAIFHLMQAAATASFLRYLEVCDRDRHNVGM